MNIVRLQIFLVNATELRDNTIQSLNGRQESSGVPVITAKGTPSKLQKSDVFE
jgi:hypothetical protein